MRTIEIGNGVISQDHEGVAFPQSSTHSQEMRDWRLVTRDDATTIACSSFFDPLARLMKVGEAIIATLDMDGTPELRVYVVTAIDHEDRVTVVPAL